MEVEKEGWNFARFPRCNVQVPCDCFSQEGWVLKQVGGYKVGPKSPVIGFIRPPIRVITPVKAMYFRPFIGVSYNSDGPPCSQTFKTGKPPYV